MQTPGIAMHSPKCFHSKIRTFTTRCTTQTFLTDSKHWRRIYFWTDLFQFILRSGFFAFCRSYEFQSRITDRHRLWCSRIGNTMVLWWKYTASANRVACADVLVQCVLFVVSRNNRDAHAIRRCIQMPVARQFGVHRPAANTAGRIDDK